MMVLLVRLPSLLVELAIKLLTNYTILLVVKLVILGHTALDMVMVDVVIAMLMLTIVLLLYFLHLGVFVK